MYQWSPGELQQFNAAIATIELRCPVEAGWLRNFSGSYALWDARVTRGFDGDGRPLYGRRDPPTGTALRILMWTGEGIQPGDWPVNWARTLTHEIQHVMEPTKAHSSMFARADYCAGL